MKKKIEYISVDVNSHEGVKFWNNVSIHRDGGQADARMYSHVTPSTFRRVQRAQAKLIKVKP